MFGRRPRHQSGLLPADIVATMDRFGRFEWDPQASDADEPVWVGQTIVRLHSIAQDAGPEAFLAELAEAVLPIGGWAVYGGERLVKDVYDGNLDNPSYQAMMRSAVQFLRSQGVSPNRLNSYEQRFWTT